MPTSIKKEVSKDTHLRRFITDLVREHEKDEEQKLDAEIRAAMVDNVLDMIGEPIELLFANCVGTEFGLYLDSLEGDEEDEDEDEDEEGDEEGEEGAPIDAEFEEETDEAA